MSGRCRNTGIRKIGRTSIQRFDGAANQYACCPHHIPIELARTVVGALVFVQLPGKAISHVAVVVEAEQRDAEGKLLVPAQIIEAPGKGKKVRKVAIRPSFNRGAKVLELYQEAA